MRPVVCAHNLLKTGPLESFRAPDRIRPEDGTALVAPVCDGSHLYVARVLRYHHGSVAG